LMTELRAIKYTRTEKRKKKGKKKGRRHNYLLKKKMSGNLYRRPLVLVLIITEHCTITFTIILISNKNKKKYLDKYNMYIQVQSFVLAYYDETKNAFVYKLN